MGTVRYSTADGKSAITQFINLLIWQRDLIDFAVSRDAEAIRILTAPGLQEIVWYEQRRFYAQKFGRGERKIRTRRDERRLAWIKGWETGWSVPCRVAIVLRRFNDRHVEAYRAAMDEVRREGTAAVISPKLAAAKEAHERLLSCAREISQWGTTPLPNSLPSEHVDQQVAVSDLIDEAPLPKAPVSGLVTIEELAKLAGVKRKTIDNKSTTLPPAVIAKAGTSPARYDYSAMRAWVAVNKARWLSGLPENYPQARQRIDSLTNRNSRDGDSVQLGS